MDSINRTPTQTEIYLPLDDLHFLLNTYTADRGRRRKAATSAVSYDKIFYFVRFWSAHGETVEWRLTASTFMEFNDWLDTWVSPATGRTLAWNSRNDGLRRLRQMFNWCCNQGYINENIRRILKMIPTPNGAKPIKQAPDLSTWVAIWEAIANSPFAVRDACVFAILAGTGCRQAECAALNVEDLKFLDDSSGFATIRDSKTGRPRIVAFDDVTGKEIKCYLSLWRVTRGPLFFSTNGEPLGNIVSTTIYRILKRAAQAAGVAGKITGTHDVRRSFATQWMRKCKGEGFSWLLAHELGHYIGGGMTGYYSKFDSDDIRVCMMKYRCSLFAQVLDAAAKKG
jgi:integrase